MKNLMPRLVGVTATLSVAVAVIWLVYSTEIPPSEPAPSVIHTPGPVGSAPRDYDVGLYPVWYTSVGPIIAEDEFSIPDDATIDSIRVGDNVFDLPGGMEAWKAKQRPRTPEEYYHGPPGKRGNGWSIWSVAVLKGHGSQFEHQ